MQIRLTVVDPLGPSAPARDRAPRSDVLVTAPAGTALAAVASALAQVVSGGDGSGTPVLYAGEQRLDAQRCTLGEPPLTDGAVLSVGAPGEPEPHPELDDAPAQLQVVAGPDAGGVHLLHGGEIRVGRSADADVPLDDPDVSRLHCTVTVSADGRVAVADLDSTNGTTVNGARVDGRAVPFAPGALLRIGESALRLAPAGGPGGRVETTPDGEGHVRVAGPAGDAAASHARVADPGPAGPAGATYHAYGSAAWGTPGASGRGPADPAVVPGQGGAPRIESEGPGAGAAPERPEARGDGGGGRAAGSGGETRAEGSRSEAPTGGAAHTGDSWSRTSAQGTGGAAHAGDGRSEATAQGAGRSQAPSPGTARAAHTGDSRGQAPVQGAGRGARAGDGRSEVTAQGAGRSQAPSPGTARAAHTGDSWSRASAQGTGGAAHAGDGWSEVPPRGGTGVGARWSQAPAEGAAGAVRPGDSRGEVPPQGARRAGNGASQAPDPGTEDAARSRAGATRPASETHGTHGTSTRRPEAAQGPSPVTPPGTPARPVSGAGDTHAGRPGLGAFGVADGTGPHPRETDGPAAPDDPALADQRSGRGRKGTPLRGTDVPPGTRRRGGIGAWARRLTGGRGEQAAEPGEAYEDEPAAGVAAEQHPVVAPAAPETWPDPATLLLTALGPGPRLWERGPGHPEALAVRLGTADRAAPDGSGLLPAVPVTAGLREVGALGLAGPRARLAGLTRAVLAQLTALHSPDSLEIVLIAADRSRSLEERTAEWSWLGWLPHVRPGHGQDCRLLLAHDREQAAARADELTRRLEDQLADAAQGSGPAGSVGVPTSTSVTGGPQPTGTAPSPEPDHSVPAPRRPSWARDDDSGADAAAGFPGPYTVVVVDGDPGGADLREAVARLALEGPRAGIHVVCLAETAAASPASPVTETYEAACAVAPTFRQCGAVALLSGDVATALRLMRVARAGGDGSPAGPVGHGTVATVDAVSAAWAERFARALAPLRTDGPASERQPRVSAPLPQAARLLDELGLARATPASLMARWADAADDAEALGGRVRAVLGAGPRGPVCADLAAQGPHLLIEGPPGSGRTELLRAVVASLAAAERPDRLGIVLVDGRGGPGAGGGHGEGLRVCTDVPHVTTLLMAHDPVRMREFAQSLSAELKRRSELLGRSDFAEWHTGRELSGRMVAQRTATARGGEPAGATLQGGAGDLDSPSSSTMRLRPGAARRQTEAAAPPLPRLVVVVDDLDALVSPALGSTGRPAAGSVMRALEAVAREGERLGVHLVAATGPCARTAETEPARRATLRVTLDAPAPGRGGTSLVERSQELGGEPAPGRGRLTGPDGRVTPFQGGRVTGRIPRTATLRPTVVPLEWHRMGDPPARRPVRELGNGPTDLALLASALERAAREVAAAKVPSLL
ncbi:FtsK/SpoIIIE family protein [Streptomyces sp. Ag82_O1-12]|uniref:FHA domain-containing protein n=1 Tax=unclassified Streptomyces TaxID=2593676 RepID=UPI000BD452AD|nr:MULTISPECIES: FHA domain-containing protein [unclassified Streptomyces]SMQ16681.1 FtsK/SpoIIIE family protein [Streptomyces sp. Ag82_O1-12]SOD45709.1 FtsK/SpoIIIE family protein [Streptomyces sp. Ag82_G6-1]